jgi:hypothetical protein
MQGVAKEVGGRVKPSPWPEVPKITAIKIGVKGLAYCLFADATAAWARLSRSGFDTRPDTAEKCWKLFICKMEMLNCSFEHSWLRDIAKVPEFQRKRRAENHEIPLAEPE